MMSFPGFGDHSAAFSAMLCDPSGDTADADLVLFVKGAIVGAVIYIDLSSIDPTDVEPLVTAAVNMVIS